MTTSSAKKSESNGTRSLAQSMPEGVTGSTQVETDVIAAIAGHVAAEVEGVASIGGDNVLRRISDSVSSDQRQKGAGIEVEAGTKEAIFDLEITVEYGRPIPDIVGEIRERIVDAVKTQIGLQAKEINITVAGIQFEKDQDSGRRRNVE